MIGGLILAAGAGTRFGPGPKQLAPFRGRPLLEHAIRAQCAVPALERVVVVLGASASRIVAALDLDRAEAVVCERWADGQAASLRCGVEPLAGADKVIVTLGDQPLVSSEAIALFVDQPAGARAVYDGRPGHPVVLGPAQLRAVAGLQGDRGAGALLDGPRIECSQHCSGRDIDTPGDLEAISHEARAVI